MPNFEEFSHRMTTTFMDDDHQGGLEDLRADKARAFVAEGGVPFLEPETFAAVFSYGMGLHVHHAEKFRGLDDDQIELVVEELLGAGVELLEAREGDPASEALDILNSGQCFDPEMKRNVIILLARAARDPEFASRIYPHS